MCKVQIPMNAPFFRNRCKDYFLNYGEISSIFQAGSSLVRDIQPCLRLKTTAGICRVVTRAVAPFTGH